MELPRVEAEEDFADDRRRLEDQVKETEEELTRMRTDIVVVPTREVIIEEFKGSPEFGALLESVVKDFQGSFEFKRLVDAEGRRTTPFIVECCHEFFRGDLTHSKDEFKDFFVDWKKKMIRARGSGSHGGSGSSH